MNEEVMYDMVQFVGLNYSSQVNDISGGKNKQLNKKLREILLTLSHSSIGNLRILLPILLKFVTEID